MIKPEISIITAVKNGESHIKKCIDSILDQTFRNFEFIITDDGSEDKTYEILQSACSDSRIKIYKNNKTIGLTKSLNQMIEKAKGKYIARIDADDTAHHNRLDKQYNFLVNNKFEAVACCSKIVDENGDQKYGLCPGANSDHLIWSLIFRNNIRHSSMMWDGSINQKYDEEFLYSQDYEMWCRMIRNGYRIGIIHEELSNICEHDKAITQKFAQEQDNYACIVTKKQTEFYLEKKISNKEAANLRLLYWQKSPLQFKQFDALEKKDLKKAVILYLSVASKFFEKEKKLELVLEELQKTISTNNIHFLLAILNWLRFCGSKNEFWQAINERYKENWNKIKFV